jgi:hypothetical protein
VPRLSQPDGNLSAQFNCLSAIPTVSNGGNHSPDFEKSARSEAAHKATMVITRGLALLGFRVLTDDVFFAKVKWHFPFKVSKSLIQHVFRFKNRLKSQRQRDLKFDLYFVVNALTLSKFFLNRAESGKSCIIL